MENKKKLALVHFIGMVLSLPVVMGAHYVYDIWPNFFTSLLFPVNESVWEHTKLFVLPIMLIYLIVYFIIGRKFKNYYPATGLSLLHMPFEAVVIYYFYLLISEVHHDMSGIIVSALILIVAFVFSYRRTIRKKEMTTKRGIVIYSIVVVYLILMAVFTYYPPKAPWLEWLFLDSENLCYGIIPN